MRERQEIADKRNAAKASIDKKKEAARSQRAELKYSNVDEIEKKIAELENRQQMTSMTLAAEKQLLKEIDALKQSKKAVAALSLLRSHCCARSASPHPPAWLFRVSAHRYH